MEPWLRRERENNFGVRRMLHAGGAPAFLCRGPRPCAAALERCACRKAAGRACPAPTFYAGERFTPPRGVFRCHRRARSGQDRSLQTTRYRCIAGEAFSFWHIFHLFCSFGTFFDCFAQIGCFCGSYYTIMIKHWRMYIFTARLLRL